MPAREEGGLKKKRKEPVLPHEKLHLEHLPNTDQTDFIITTSGSDKINIINLRFKPRSWYIDGARKYSDRYDTVFSADEGGFIDNWQPIELFTLPWYEFKKSKSIPASHTHSSSFVAFSLPDRQIRVFSFLTGTLARKYDESPTAIQGMQQAGTAVYKLLGPDGLIPGHWSDAVWDESGALILYPSLLAIKVVNIVTNRVVRLLGKDEVIRFLNISIYQAAPAKRTLTNGTITLMGIPAQCLFFIPGNGSICHILADKAPKAVENFVGHSRSGDFEGVIFHRVIPKFMIQTGDPLGGTGGDSIWGREFEDELSDDLKHDRCRTLWNEWVAFFITTTTTPWLDTKHTIFGRVISGLEVVHAIEHVKVNKGDKPFEDIKIVNIDVE
ncbi:cyclophilin-like protein [Hymenopellis radicata]|nr:cyclophilin-like protein [Hymenopellis radicata]